MALQRLLGSRCNAVTELRDDQLGMLDISARAPGHPASCGRVSQRPQVGHMNAHRASVGDPRRSCNGPGASYDFQSHLEAILEALTSSSSDIVRVTCIPVWLLVPIGASGGGGSAPRGTDVPATSRAPKDSSRPRYFAVPGVVLTK